MVGIRWNLGPMSCLPLSCSPLLIVAFCPLVLSVGFPLPGLFLSSHSYSWGNAYFENVLQTQAPLRLNFHSLASGSDNLCYCTDVKPLNELPFILRVRRFIVGGAWVPAVVMVMMGWVGGGVLGSSIFSPISSPRHSHPLPHKSWSILSWLQAKSLGGSDIHWRGFGDNWIESRGDTALNNIGTKSQLRQHLTSW